MDIAQVPSHPLVAASILSADFARMAEDCRDVLDLGADLLHLDVMDGHFVPNLTMGADMCRALREHFPKVFLDTHLMVQRPGDFVEMFAQAGTSLLTFHAELSQPLRRDAVDAGALIDRIHALGVKAGMAINPSTGARVLEPWLEKLDVVLLMSVNPGRSGQAFMPEVLDKARWISQRIGDGTRLEMDGGLNPETAVQAAEAGVDMMVTASALFGASDRAAVIEAFHQAGRGDA